MTHRSLQYENVSFRVPERDVRASLVDAKFCIYACISTYIGKSGRQESHDSDVDEYPGGKWPAGLGDESDGFPRVRNAGEREREQPRARKYCTRLAEGEVTFAPDASCRLSGVNCEHFTGGEGTTAGASADVVKGRARMPFAATAASRCAAPFFEQLSGGGGGGEGGGGGGGGGASTSSKPLAGRGVTSHHVISQSTQHAIDDSSQYGPCNQSDTREWECQPCAPGNPAAVTVSFAWWGCTS